MLQIENLTFVYPGQESPALHSINLTVESGDFLAVMGSNGSGKSTLCKLFNGIIPHFFVGDIDGLVLVDGVDTQKSDVATLSFKVRFVYQDFESSSVRPTVFDEVSFAALNYGLDDFKERAAHAMEILGISHLKGEYIWQLSGGQKHLVALAAVMSVDPDYIIVDEPVAQLDPYNAHQTYKMLKLLNEEYGKTIIVIEHHTEFIAAYCREVLLMKEGRLLWKKPVKEALTSLEELAGCCILPPQVTQIANQLQAEYTNTYLSNLPINVEEGAAFFEDLTFKRIIMKEPPLHPSGEPTVCFRNVSAEYKDYKKNDKAVLNNVSLSFYPGERIALVGNNGAGKTTLLRMISGLMKPSKGTVEIMGINAAVRSLEEIADVVSFIYQDPEEMFIDDSVEKDVSFFLRSRKKPDYVEIVERIIKSMNLESLRERDARLLSGGQQRRVSLAIGMGMTPKIILLDEPTSSLDIVSRQELVDLLHLLRHTIQTAVVATHDMQLVADWATRVIVLHGGDLIFDSTPRKLFTNTEIMGKANLIPPQIVQLCHELSIFPPFLGVDEMVRNVARSLKIEGGIA